VSANERPGGSGDTAGASRAPAPPLSLVPGGPGSSAPSAHEPAAQASSTTAPPQRPLGRGRAKQLRAQLEEASIALRSMEAVTDPALALLPLDELLDAVLARTKEAVGGDVVAVLLLDERGDEGTVLRVRAVQGASRLAPVGSELLMGQGVVGTAAQWGRPVVVPEVAAMHGQPTPEARSGLASLMAAPLMVQGTILGMVEVGSTSPRSFDAADLRLLQVVADRCAASIERARLDEVARRNRLGAEHANLHLRIIARGSKVLGRALESYEDTFEQLAEVIVPDFADWFSADALDDSGRVRRIAARGKSRGVVVGKAFKGVRHPHPEGDRLVRLAMAERRPQVYMRTNRLREDELGAAIHTPMSLGSWPTDVTSMMIVPMRVKGSFWGALSFVTGPGRRGYRPSDLFTAREIADRVGVAVERVVSWRTSHRAGEDAVHYAERLQRLVEAALVVNAQLAEEEVLELLVEHTRRVLDAEVAVVVGRRVAGWFVEKASPEVGGGATGEGRLPARPRTVTVVPVAPSPGSPAPGGSGQAGPELKRMVLAAADVVARTGSVVRRPDDWPGATPAAGTVGIDAVLDAAGPGRAPRRRTAPRLGVVGAGPTNRGTAGGAEAGGQLSSIHGRGWLGAPITERTGACNRVVVAVGGPGSRFTVEDESVLTLLAQMASVALQNASLYADVRTNERRLQAVVESSPLAIAELRPTGEARWWNAAASQLFGWEGRVLPRIPVRPGSELVLAGLLEAGRAGKPAIGVAMPALGAGGNGIDLSVSVSPLGEIQPERAAPTRPARHAKRGTVTGLLLVAEDVTERTRLLEQFHQAERLNAMTRMAGAVAHDFNNLLTVILGCSDVIGRRLGDDDDLGQDVEAIQRAGTRAAALTSQLVRIGQQRPVQPEVVDVDEVLRSIAPMLAGVLGEHVTLELVTRASGRAQPADAVAGDDGRDGTPDGAGRDPTTPAAGKAPRRRRRSTPRGRILVDRTELERSILNLAINAHDAMPAGGTVTVRTATTAPRPDAEGRAVQLVFADTGVGMDPDTASHCFEPFFTTKGRARGTGLGLATVHATVTQAGGSVGVETSPGKGARFTLSFPAYDGRVAEVPAAAIPQPGDAPRAREGGETLLVVDDEPEVLRLEVRELQLAGYEVVGASNASEALHLLNGRGGAVDLLVTDVVMPGMNGIDLAYAARRRYPHVRVLFVSGHLDEGATVDGPLPQDATLLTKPFRPEELSRSVRESLDRAVDPPPARRPTVPTP
jgi:signal transduction histidine kinase/ActR/RegA family two-component response regulator